MATRYEANPNCKECKGTGIAWFMVGDEPEKDACDCVHEVEIEMKRFRGSIYLDVNAENKAEALKVMQKIEYFLNNPSDHELPDNYYNAYVGGVGQWIVGDLLGNAKRTEHI